MEGPNSRSCDACSAAEVRDAIHQVAAVAGIVGGKNPVWNRFISLDLRQEPDELNL
jgi:hypothetical protein